jgi:hypothetical protein
MILDALPYGLTIAMVSGLFGATFFMLIQLQSRLSEGGLADVRDMWTFPMLLLRCIVGVGAAAILYFLFKSGLLSGTIWPNLDGLGFVEVTRHEVAYLDNGRRVVPNQQYALLIVWSFIAGYSQTLVPNLLITTEARTNST